MGTRSALRHWLFGLILSSTLLPQIGYSVPVTLDGSFGNGGKAQSNFRGGFDDPVAPVRDASGRYLFLSISDLGAQGQINVTRLTAAGQLDPSFGDAGIASVHPINNFLYPGWLTLDGAGRILIAYATYGEFCNAVGVTRLTASGDLDTGFGTGGTVQVDPSGLEFGGCGFLSSNSIAWNGLNGVDYRIGLATTSSNAAGTSTHGTLTQLLENGGVDAGFGGNGVVQLAVGSASTFKGLMYSGNRLYAWGSRTMGAASDVLLARFQADGSVDSLFGSVNAGLGPGYIVAPFGGNSVAHSLVETSCPSLGGGCFYIAGSVEVGGVRQALVARYVAFISGCLTRGGTHPCLHTNEGAFDTDGWTTLDFGGSTLADEFHSVVVQPGAETADQLVLVSGITSTIPNFGVGEAFVARYLATGSLDPAYGGGDGVADDALGTDVGTRAFGVRDPSGAMFVLGRGSNGGAKDSVAGRQLANGTLDTAGFGNGGTIRIQAAGAQTGANDMTLDAGRPLLVGIVRNAVDARFELGLSRFTAAGLRDTAFDGDGQATYSRVGDTFAEGYGVAVQSDGRIVVVGTTSSAIDSRLTVLRVESNGAIDTSFGVNGYFRLEGVDFSSVGRDVLVESSGRIVAVGNVSNGSSNDVVAVGLTSSGTLDSFGTGNLGYQRVVLASNDGASEIRPYPGGGYAILGSADTRVLLVRLDAAGLPVSASVDALLTGTISARALAVDGTGRFYMGGIRNGSTPVLARFASTGLLDTAWGNLGEASFGGLPGSIEAVDLDSASRPVFSGIYSSSTSEMIVYRALADGTAADTDFNGTGKAQVPFSAFGFGQAQILGADGSILLGGQGGGQMAVAKLATRVASSVALSVDVNPSQFNQTATFTATASGSSGTPTGSVELFAGPTSLGSASLSGAGIASIPISTLEVGNYDITATYSGDSVYAPSTSAPALAFVVAKANTTATVVNLDPDATTASGENVTFDIDVTGAFGTVPTGSVEFFVDNVSMGMLTLAFGGFNFTTDDLQPGEHDIHVVYQGDQRHNVSPASATVVHTVGKAASGTSLNVDPSPSSLGQTVTLTATVGGQAATPVTGMVEFRDGANVLATISLPPNGQVAHTTSALTRGSHALTAVYLGSDSYTGSTSAMVNHEVLALISSTSLMVTPSPSNVAENVTLTANVTGQPGVPVSGDVEFRDGVDVLATVSLSSGQAQFSTTALAAGSHSLTAVYLGDASYSGSTSPTVIHGVGALGSSTSLMVTPSPSSLGQNVDLVATVLGQAAVAVTGSVEFRDDGNLLATVTLVNGQATFSTTALALGNHPLRATYLGSASYNGSTSLVVDHTVVALDPHIFGSGFEGPP